MIQRYPVRVLIASLAVAFPAVGFSQGTAPAGVPAPGLAATAAPLGVGTLSPQAMKLLVSGIAFYPDPLIEQILAAAQDLPALHAAAREGAQPGASEALKTLARYPEILQQLDRHAANTARLGAAAKTQLADVWTAIDEVRADFAAFQQANANTEEDAGTSSSSSGTTGAATPVVRPYGAFVAGLLADDLVDELNNRVVVTTPAGTVVVTGNGTSGAVVAGETTLYGAAGAGTVTTSNGASVSGAGAVGGTVTTTENGASFTKNSAGVVVNNNTGAYAAGKRSTSGSVTQNADGSTSFSRSASTQTASSYGSSSVTHNSSGTVTGDGNGSFQGSTTIDSSHGDASVTTQAGNGQVTTTVTTDNGTKQYTAGDGQVQQENLPANGTSAERSAKSSSSSTSENRFQSWNEEQIRNGSRMLSESWGQLEQGRDAARSGFQRPTSDAGSFNNALNNALNGARSGASAHTPANVKPNVSGQRGGAPSRGGRGGRGR